MIRKSKDQHYDRMTDPLCRFDSRCRKQKYIEQLEQERKFYIDRNRQLEDERTILEAQMNNCITRNEELLVRNDYLSREIETLKSGRRGLAEKQSELSAIVFLSPDASDFDQFARDMDSWERFFTIEDLHMDSNPEVDM
jgi:hypothetical protein